MSKENIVLVINDFGIGGAEMLLIGILPELNERYNVTLVTLNDKNYYGDKAFVCAHKYILGFTGKLSFFKCIKQLRKIIKKHRPVLVHSHLFYSNMIARIACSSKTPCLFTIHGLQSYDIYSKSLLWTWLEKITLRPYHSIMVVSHHLLEDFEKHIGKVEQSFVLPNYVEDIFFETAVPEKNYNVFNQLKLIAVGNLKPIKNYAFLIEAFKKLNTYPLRLDIYGEDQGDLFQLGKIVADNNLPIEFKGRGYDINELLLQYDMYVMSSKSEGCSVAVLEAMSMGLPLLLADLPGLKIETMGNALFFDTSSEQTFISKIEEIFKGLHDLNNMSKLGIKMAKDNYTKKIYMQKLFAIYDTV